MELASILRCQNYDKRRPPGTFLGFLIWIGNPQLSVICIPFYTPRDTPPNFATIVTGTHWRNCIVGRQGIEISPIRLFSVQKFWRWFFEGSNLYFFWQIAKFVTLT
jgi:hypothetical protein